MKPGKLHLFLSLIFSACLLWILLADPAGATTLSDKEFQCAFCGKNFQDRILRSTNVMGRDAELRPFTMGLEPTPYFIHTCPHCGFTDYSHDVELSAGGKKLIAGYLASYCQEHNCAALSPSQKYELLANLYILRQKPAMTIAFQYHRAAWMADDIGDEEAGRRLRTEAVGFMVKALDNKEVEAERVPTVTYLVGELYRRTGKFAEALAWFARVQAAEPQLAALVQKQQALAAAKDARPAKMVKN